MAPEIRILLFCVLLPVFLLLVGIAYQVLGLWRDRRLFRPPGRLITIGSHRLHAFESGRGAPTVVLEAGIAGSSLSWTVIHRLVASFAHVVSYDRSGLGWSENAPQAGRDLAGMTDELASLLHSGDFPPPYILVGHSFGALVVRAFAHLHPECVAGIVLVDPVSIEGWGTRTGETARRVALGARLSRRGALLSRLGVVRAALAILMSGRQQIPKLITRTTAGPGNSVVERLVGEVKKLPPETWPAIQAHWSNPKCFRAMAEHLECLSNSANLARDMPLPEAISVVILSAGTATDQELFEREQWARANAFVRHLRVDGTGHWLQLERPEAVVNVIHEILEKVSSPVL